MTLSWRTPQFYEVGPRKDIVASIWFPTRCHSAGCGVATQTQRATPSATQSISALARCCDSRLRWCGKCNANAL